MAKHILKNLSREKQSTIFIQTFTIFIYFSSFWYSKFSMIIIFLQFEKLYLTFILDQFFQKQTLYYSFIYLRMSLFHCHSLRIFSQVVEFRVDLFSLRFKDVAIFWPCDFLGLVNCYLNHYPLICTVLFSIGHFQGFLYNLWFLEV